MSTRLDVSRIFVNRPSQTSAAVANSTNPITNNSAWGIIEGEPDGVDADNQYPVAYGVNTV